MKIEFFNHLGLLLGLMVGMTTFKIVSCKPFKEKGDEFNLKKLFQGCLGQLVVLLGCFVVYLTGCKCGEDLLLVQISGVNLTVQNAIDVVILMVDAFYAVKFIKNLLTFFGIKNVDVNTTNSCSSNCEHGELIGYCYAAKNTTTSCNDLIQPADVNTIIDAAIVAPEGEIN